MFSGPPGTHRANLIHLQEETSVWCWEKASVHKGPTECQVPDMLSYYPDHGLIQQAFPPQMKKLKQREAREAAQGHTANELQSWDSNPGWLYSNTELSP